MSGPRRIAVVTGSRAEWGLLQPVARAVSAESDLIVQIVAAGAHFLSPAESWREIEFTIDARVPMQIAGQNGRHADAVALGRGVTGFAEAFARLAPDWVVVLGDRIEAFAAASAASVGGIAVAHIHGGDRAEGVADEAMRHAITKLSHLHLAATAQSAERIVRMGERPEFVHVVGSPAIDALSYIEPAEDASFDTCGSPEIVVLHHPSGLGTARERACAMAIREAVHKRRVLWMQPNHDPDREAIISVIDEAVGSGEVQTIEHLARPSFIALLKRVADSGGVMVGNSSAGLIEAAALRLPVVDIGPRQSGRERPNNVVRIESPSVDSIRDAMVKARAIDRSGITHPYGEGYSGEAIADSLGSIDPHDPALLRKRNTY